MRKASEFVLLVVLFVSSLFMLSVNASEIIDNHNGNIEAETFDLEKEYIKLYLQNVHETEIDIQNLKPLLNTSGFAKYLYVTFFSDNGEGYVILDIDNFTIIEMATNHTAPFDDSKEMIYIGPLSYIEISGNKLIEPFTKEEVTESDLLTIQSRTITELSLEEKLEKIETLKTKRATRKTITGAGNSSWAFSAGRYYGDCGINVVAMIEKWYDKYESSNYLPPSLSSEAEIKESIFYFLNEQYEMTESRAASCLRDHSREVGLNGKYIYTSHTSYDWADTCNRLDDDYPVILSIKYHPVYNYHYVVAVGYSDDGDPDYNQLYINDGWGDYVWIDQSYANQAIFTY